ncbi:hypothetical protein D3C81_2246690 [compost metagenome]
MDTTLKWQPYCRLRPILLRLRRLTAIPARHCRMQEEVLPRLLALLREPAQRAPTALRTRIRSRMLPK